MLSPSEIVARPASLTERLAAEIPVAPEPTPSIMAERFAPESQKSPSDAPARQQANAPMPGLIAEQTRAPAATRWLLIASIIVSLVPTAIILALIWQGAIRLPKSDGVTVQERFVDTHQAAV